MLGLSPRLSVIFNSLALCFWQPQQHQRCLCQSFVFRLKFFASAKTSLKRAQRNNIFASTNFGCFSSSAALAFALTFAEKTFRKFWLFKQNFSKIQPIAHILWSIQRVPIAFTGRTPALYIRTFSSSLLRAIIARNHLLFFKIISNFEHFCPNFQIFCCFLPFLAFFCIFLPFFWKIERMPSLSVIAPIHFELTFQNTE